jgi:Ca2+-binding RTX toxin-like protein
MLALMLLPASSQAAVPRCNFANATMVGTSGPDVLRGTSEHDVIVGRGGNDRIYGLGKGDYLCGGRGRDVLFGGPAADGLFGGRGDDRFYGGHGRDAMNPYDPGDDYYNGGVGTDHLDFETRQQVGRGITVDLGRGYIRAGAGRDRIEKGTVEGASGTNEPDVIRGDGRANDLNGGVAPTTTHHDVLIGRGGDDDLLAFGEGTVARGGDGDDAVTLPEPGGSDESALHGGQGRDRVEAPGLGCGGIPPTTTPEVVIDLTSGQATDATVTGFEDVQGSSCNDTLIGDEGANRLYGGEGDDDIQGMAGNDDVRGDDWFSSQLTDGEGDDTLDGGDGTDSAEGGDGTDTCTNFEAQLSCEL